MLRTGVNGHTDTCHGGFTALIIDEVLGNVAERERPFDKSTMTAYLKVDYKKPIRTPGKILCRARVEKKEGRKLASITETGTFEGLMAIFLRKLRCDGGRKFESVANHYRTSCLSRTFTRCQS